MVRLQSIGARLVAVVLAATLPLAAAMGYFWWESLQQTRAREIALLQARVGQIQRDLEGLRSQSEWVLSRMASRPAFRALSPAACDDEMAVIREINPAFLLVTLWSKEGGLVCSSIPPRPGQPRPQPHRKSFDEGIATDGLYLSNFFRGEITGLPLVTFTYPVKSPAGEVVGLLSIPVRMDYFESLLHKVEPRSGSAAGIADRNFVIVARVPDNALWQGKSAAHIASAATPAPDEPGVLLSPGVDSRKRIVVRESQPATGWQAFVGVEVDVLFAGARRRLVQGAALVAAVTALGLGIAYLIGRGISQPLRRLVSVADAVAQGDRAARAGVVGDDEISRLAGQVNRMLDSLERSEASLRASTARARELSSRLLTAEEAERKRIAHDLHDQLGQELTALKIRLETLARTAESPQARAQILDIAALAGDALQRVRQMSVDLRPPQLDSLGLAAALRAHVERLSSAGKLELKFDSRGIPARIPPDLEIICFRVAQEALTNVMRHSGARNAWIDLAMENGYLRLSVRDDGRGFDAAQVLERGTVDGAFGLAGMRERVALVGGSLDIRSYPAQGCAVTAMFSLAGTWATA